MSGEKLDKKRTAHARKVRIATRKYLAQSETLKNEAKDQILLSLSESQLDALMLSISNALRRAVGFPEKDDPYIVYSDEPRPHHLRIFACRVLIAAHAPAWQNPRAAEDELWEIYHGIDDLRNRICALDSYSQIILNAVGCLEQEDFETAKRSGEVYRMISALGGMSDNNEDTVPAAVSAMTKLQEAIGPAIVQTILAGTRVKKTGSIPRHSKRDVALVVAQFMHEVTGNIPGLTTRPVVTGPFALALQEMFEILNLPKGVQRPGKWAISELTSKPSKYSEL